MKKHFISYIITIAIMIAPIYVFFFSNTLILEQEKRMATKLPNISEIKHSLQFCRSMEMYFNDHFPFRNEIINLISIVNLYSYADNDSNKCYRGKDNWLFLGNDYEKCVDVLTGKIKLNTIKIDKRIQFFKEIQSIANEYGSDFHMMIGSNKSTIYQEYLPRTIFINKDRFIEPVIDRFINSGISIFDTSKILLNNKNKGLLYWRTDTHWNELGSYIALKEWFKQIDIPNIPVISFKTNGTTNGGLVKIGGYSSFPLSEGDTYKIDVDYNSIKFDDTSSILILGDSFSRLPSKYIKMMFKNVTRVHYEKIFKKRKMNAKYLKEYIESMPQKPNHILWIQVERAFNTYFQ